MNSIRGYPDQSVWDMSHAGTEPGAGRTKLKLKEVAAILQERGLEPIGAICDVLDDLQPALKAKTLLSLAEFVYPKLGRTVIAGDPDAPVTTVSRVELVALK